MPDFSRLRRAKPAKKVSATSIVATLPKAPTLPPVQAYQGLQFRSGDREILKLQNDRFYWVSIIQDAQRGVFPFATIGLSGLGVATAKTGGGKLLAGLLGLWIGNEIDKSMAASSNARKQAVIANAQKKIQAIDKRILELKKIDKEIASMKQLGTLVENKDLGLFSPIIGGEDYRKAEIPSLGFKGEFSYLMGDPSPGFLLLVTGTPGQGKSTFAVRFGQYFQENHGKVLYLASEQPKLNRPLQSLFKRHSATFDIHTKPTSDIDQLSREIKPYELVIIDSVNHLGISANGLEQLREVHPKKSFVAIMQSTKEGNFKGSQEFLHNCDIKIEMERPNAIQTKSRFAPPSEIPMFEEV